MSTKPHFEQLGTWEAARRRLDFELVAPHETSGYHLSSLSVFVRDHKMREVPPEKQSLEAHYGGFVFTQSRPGTEAARHAVREVSYGTAPRAEQIGHCEARVYERGPEPEPDYPDGRMPAVVVWSDEDRFYLLASDLLDAPGLLRIARSVAPGQRSRG